MNAILGAPPTVEATGGGYGCLEGGVTVAENTYQKTPLWNDMFALKTDGLVRPAVRH